MFKSKTIFSLVAFLFISIAMTVHAEESSTSSEPIIARPVFMVASTTPTLFSKYLTLGATGAEVEALQSYLEEKGFLIIPQGVAKGFFGNLTRRALMHYQKENGIDQTGTTGPKTRAHINGKNDASNITKTSGGANGPIRGLMVRTPTQKSIDACTGKQVENACSFANEQGDTVSGSCIPAPQSENGSLMCGPSFRGAR